jgi:uncharacterized protein
MKIAIVGATGNVGRRLVAEALRRRHDVISVTRGSTASNPAPSDRLTSKKADADDPSALAKAISGADVVISSVKFTASDPSKLIEAVRLAGVERYLVVGGAGSLWTSPGQLHIDSPHFPVFAKDEALGGKRFLDQLRDVQDVEWTMLSPSALFTAGERTTTFRLGDDTLLTGADGKSWISYEDFAIAMLDEVETPRHIRRRFTVGY